MDDVPAQYPRTVKVVGGSARHVWMHERSLGRYAERGLKMDSVAGGRVLAGYPYTSIASLVCRYAGWYAGTDNACYSPISSATRLRLSHQPHPTPAHMSHSPVATPRPRHICAERSGQPFRPGDACRIAHQRILAQPTLIPPDVVVALKNASVSLDLPESGNHQLPL